MLNKFKIFFLGLFVLTAPALADIDHFYDGPFGAIDPYSYVYDNNDNYFDDYFYNNLDYYYCPYRWCCGHYRPCRNHDYYGYFQRDGRVIRYRGGSYGSVSRG